MSELATSTGADDANRPPDPPIMVATTSYGPGTTSPNSKMPVFETAARCDDPVATLPRRGTNVTAAPSAGKPVAPSITCPRIRAARPSLNIKSSPFRSTPGRVSTAEAPDASIVPGKYTGRLPSEADRAG